MVLILLQETNNIGLCPSLNEVLISTTLRIINLHVSLRLNLSHQIDLLKLSHKNLVVSLLVLVHNAQKVVFVGLVIEDRAIVHIVFKNSDTLSLVVDLA